MQYQNWLISNEWTVGAGWGIQAEPQTIFTSDFEGADGEWNGTYTAGDGTATLDKNTNPYAGSEHAEFNFTAGGVDAAYAYVVFPSNYSQIVLSAWVSFNTTADWRNVMRFTNNTGGYISTIMFSYGDWRMFYCNGTTLSSTTETQSIGTNRYQNLTLSILVHPTIGYYKFYVNSTLVIDITNLDTTLRGQVYGFHMGHSSGSTYTNVCIRVDDVVVKAAEEADDSPTYGSISYNTTAPDMPCNFSCWFYDDYGLSGFIFGTNNTGTATNDTWQTLSGTIDLASAVKTLNDTATAVVQFWFYANDTGGNWTNTGVQSLTVADEPPQYGAVSTNATQPNRACNFTAAWTDDLGLSGYIFGSNNTGTWVNQTFTSFSGMSNTSDWVLTLNSTGGILVQYRFWANDTADQWNNTGARNLYLGGANDFYADNGTAVGIQAAVDAAEASGLIPANVHIPEGTWNFTDSGEWDDQSVKVTIPAGINIFGAPCARGTVVINGETMTGMNLEYKTVLRMSYDVPSIVPGDYIPNWFHFEGTNNASEPSRFSDIKLVGWRYYVNTSTYQSRGITCDNVIDMRVDHVFMQDICAGNWMGADANKDFRGVVDHSVFINTHVAGIHYPEPYSTRTNGYGWGISAQSTTYWDEDIDSIQGEYGWMTVYIENCYFEKWRHCFTGGHGSHVVFRYNVVKNDYGFGSVDSHGTYEYVGTRATEIYENKFLDPMWSGHGVHFLRGGAAVYFNNTVRNDGDGYYYVLCQLICENAQVNYDDDPEDVYIWDNTLACLQITVDNDGNPTPRVEGTHYFFYAMPGYTPYTYPHPLITQQDSEATNPVCSIYSSNNTIADKPTKLYTYWSDDVDLSHYCFEHNNTGTFANTSFYAFSSNPGWANLTVTLNSSVGVVVAWRVFANDTDGEWGTLGYQLITVVGDVYPSYSSVGYSTNKAAQSCKFYSYWSDDYGLSFFILETNGTGTLINYTIAFSANPSWANYTVVLTSQIGAVVAYRFHGNDTLNQFNTTAWLYFTTSDNPPSYTVIGHTTNRAGQNCKFFVRWGDDIGLQYYIFQHNNTGTLTNYTYAFGGSIWSNRTITLTLTVGATIQWRFYANDTAGQWTLTTIQTFVILTSDVPPKYGAYSVSTTVAGAVATFSCAWTNDPYLSHGVLMTNNTGTWVNYTVALSGISDTFVYVLTLNSVVGVKVAYRFYANDTANSWNQTSLLYLTTTFQSEITPSTYPFVDSVFQFIFAGDFIGALQAIWVRGFGVADLFFGVVIFAFSMVFYIRVKSIVVVSIAWILVGGLFISLVPLLGSLAIFLLALGVGSLLFRLFLAARD